MINFDRPTERQQRRDYRAVACAELASNTEAEHVLEAVVTGFAALTHAVFDLADAVRNSGRA